MANTDDPVRLLLPKSHVSRWPRFADIRVLPPPLGVDRSILSVLSQRRSALEFGPLSLEALSSWLYFTASWQVRAQNDEHRKKGYCPSFGALQSTHILIGSPDGDWNLYLPAEHALTKLPNKSVSGESLRSDAMEFFAAPTASIVALVSDCDLVHSYYQNPISLQLREAGALLGQGGLVAEAWGLRFRILGALGNPWSVKLLSDVPVTLTATGLALLGGPVENSPVH